MGVIQEPEYMKILRELQYIGFLQSYNALLLLLLSSSFTAIELSLGGSSPYTSIDSCHSVAVVLTLV
jgi:hypothetical protein